MLHAARFYGLIQTISRIDYLNIASIAEIAYDSLAKGAEQQI
jgi:hypothetical protein